MTIEQMLNAYSEINANLEPLLEHDLQAVRSSALTQIDRNVQSMRDLNDHLKQYAR